MANNKTCKMSSSQLRFLQISAEVPSWYITSPVLRNNTMLNMERMVGTITPKNVLSFRGSLLGVREVQSGDVSTAVPQVAMLRPHTPEVMRGLRSFDMAASSVCPVERKSDKGLIHLNLSVLLGGDQQRRCRVSLRSRRITLTSRVAFTSSQFYLCLAVFCSVQHKKKKPIQ